MRKTWCLSVFGGLAVVGALLLLARCGYQGPAGDGGALQEGQAQENLLRLVPPTQRPGPATRAGQSATSLSEGRWLLAGGLDDDGHVSDEAWLLARATAAPVPVGHLQVARVGHTASLLPDGRVLVLGGIDAEGTLVARAEAFDLRRQTSQAVDLPPDVPRAYHSATVLTDGSILVAGGVDATGVPRASAALLNLKTAKSLVWPLTQGRAGHRAQLLASGDVWLAEDFGALHLEDERLEPKNRRALPCAESCDEPAAPLRVAGSVPTEAADDVASDAVVGLRFNRPVVDIQDAPDAEIVLVGPHGQVNAQTTLAEAGRLLFVTPQPSLLPGSDYTLYVRGLRDADGERLPRSTLHFHTAAHSASQPPRRPLLPQPDALRPAATASSLDAYQASVTSHHAALADALPRRGEASDGSPDEELWYPDETNHHGHWTRPLPDIEPILPLKASAGLTALSGIVRRLNGSPLPGVTLSVGSHSTTTDAQGRFLLQGVPAGKGVLVMEGATAQPTHSYGRYEARVQLVANQTNVLPYTIWMTKLDPQGTVSIDSPTREETVITTPSIPNLALHLPAGTVIRDAHGSIVTQINITAIPINQPPFPLPSSTVPVYFTIQPGGAILQGIDPNFRGARLYYPNYRHEIPKAKGMFFNYDASGNGWYVYGLGTISPDGLQAIPDPGVAIYEFTGAMFNGQPPPPPPPPPEKANPFPDNIQSCTDDASCSGGSGAGSAGGDAAGEPVSLYTGQFDHDGTDLRLADVIPIALTRHYNSKIAALGLFGVGTASTYDLFFYTSSSTYQNVTLYMPSGNAIIFNRTSPGTDYASAVFLAQQGTYGPWSGATIRFNDKRSGWDLLRRDSTNWFFPIFSPLQEIRDRNGNLVTITRQGGTSGPISRIESSNGRWINLTIDPNGRATAATDSAGRQITYGYDASGRFLKTVSYMDGGIIGFGYDGNNLLNNVTNADGNTILRNVYDGNGLVLNQTLGDGSTFSYGARLYNYLGQLYSASVTDRAGSVRTVQFDSYGNITQDTAAIGTSLAQNTNFTLTGAYGGWSQVTDANGRVTAYTYDNLGNCNTITWLAGSPNAVTTHATFSAPYSQPTSSTDALGNTASFVYDANGNLLTATDPLGHTTRLTYDVQGRVLSMTNPNNQLWTFTYVGPDMGSVTDSNGLMTQYYHDAAGRLTGIRSPAGNLTTLTYDVRDRVLSVTDALGNATSMTYNHTGNMLTLTDARGHTTHYTYAPLGQLASRTDALSRTESYSYDRAGRPSHFTDRKGQVRGWTYDALGRMTQAGFGATAANPNSYSNTITYAYDIVNRVTSATDSNGMVVSRTYDGLDRVLTESQPAGNLAYAWDADGRLSSMTVTGQPAVTYTYDAASNPNAISQNGNVWHLAYDILNRRSSVTWPTGLKKTYTYDISGHLSGLTYTQNSNSLGNLIYNYNADSKIASVSGSLANVMLPAAASGLIYDSDNQLTQNGNQAVTYDADGNLYQDGTNTYVWDARNHLSSMSGGFSAQFTYLPTGQRLSKTVSGTGTRFLYNGSNFVQEQSATGAVTANLMVGGVDEVFRRIASSEREYLTDIAGSTVALVSTTGSVQTNYTYTSYGLASSSGSTDSGSQKYTGREDDGTGLVYFRTRYYAPSLGRFLSQDRPFGRGGINLYAYGYNDPVLMRDPLGMSGQPSAPGSSNALTNAQVFADMNMQWWNPVDDLTFAALEWPGSTFDYKRQGKCYEDFGNYNFGMMASTMGFSYWFSQSMAGVVQITIGHRPASVGIPFFTFPYGDAPNDAGPIQNGYNDGSGIGNPTNGGLDQ